MVCGNCTCAACGGIIWFDSYTIILVATNGDVVDVGTMEAAR